MDLLDQFRRFFELLFAPEHVRPHDLAFDQFLIVGEVNLKYGGHMPFVNFADPVNGNGRCLVGKQGGEDQLSFGNLQGGLINQAPSNQHGRNEGESEEQKQEQHGPGFQVSAPENNLENAQEIHRCAKDEIEPCFQRTVRIGEGGRQFIGGSLLHAEV